MKKVTVSLIGQGVLKPDACVVHSSLDNTGDEPRSAVDVTLGERAFSRGHHFVISPFVLGRDERFFPGANVFDPLRSQTMATDATSLPFGSGPHGCPGTHLATTVLTTIASVVAGGFEVERCPGEVVPDARSTLLPRGLRMRFVPSASPNQPKRTRALTA